MIEVEAHVRYWTPDGMQPRPRMTDARRATGYIEVTEVERLLEEAYRTGAADVKARMADVLSEAVISVTQVAK